MTTITPTIRPTPKQQKAWDVLSFNNRVKKFVGFGGGAGGGKTWMACEWLITNCYMYPNSRWFIGRQELTRLKKSTFVTFKKVCRYHKIPDADWHLDGQNNVIIFVNGSTIDLIDVAFKPTDPDYERFGSLEYTGGFGEEAGEWNFGAFDILKSRVGRHNIFDTALNTMCEKPIDFDAHPERHPNIAELPPKLLITFNPSRGWLYRTFYEPWKNGTLPAHYEFIQVLYKDNPYVAKLYGEQLEGIVNKVNKARLKDGDWEYTDDINAMTTLEHLQDMFSNTVVIDGEKYMTIDVARGGEDSTVFTIWEDMEVKRIVKKAKQATNITVQDAKDMAAVERIPYSHIAVDVIGVGAGVADGLVGCVAFNSNSTPFLLQSQIRDKKKRVVNDMLPAVAPVYANLKTQCAFKLAEIINDHLISAANVGDYRDEIIADLTATLQERDIDKDGKKKMATKEDIKEELGRSPDVGDTFLMRMYWVLKDDARDEDPVENKIISTKQTHSMKMNMANMDRNSTK
jgi:phage terminase large subunit